MKQHINILLGTTHLKIFEFIHGNKVNFFLIFDIKQVDENALSKKRNNFNVFYLHKSTKNIYFSIQ